MSYGIGAIVVNPSLSPFGGFQDAGGNPLYNTPESLAAAVNANYQAQGVATRVSSDQMQQYFKATPTIPLSNAPSPGYTPPAASVNPPPAPAKSTNALAVMSSYTPPAIPPMGQDPSETEGLLNRVQDAIASVGSTTSPLGSNGLMIILAVIGIGIALMSGKGEYEN